MLCTGNDSLVCVCDLQEAFCSIEDIHGLISMVKKTPKPQMMAIYYAKLMKIFWISDSHLYHAYAWYKLYNLQKSYKKNLMAKDLQLMASSVLLATLAVTPCDRKHGALNWKWRKIGIYKWPIFWVSLLSPRRILTPSGECLFCTICPNKLLCNWMPDVCSCVHF